MASPQVRQTSLISLPVMAFRISMDVIDSGEVVDIEGVPQADLEHLDFGVLCDLLAYAGLVTICRLVDVFRIRNLRGWLSTSYYGQPSLATADAWLGQRKGS